MAVKRYLTLIRPDVSDGSKPEVSPLARHVRSTPQEQTSYGRPGMSHIHAPLYRKAASDVGQRPRPPELLQILALFVDLSAYDVTEQFPALALEFPELKLLDRSEVSRAGVDRYAGQEPFQLQTLNASPAS